MKAFGTSVAKLKSFVTMLRLDADKEAKDSRVLLATGTKPQLLVMTP